MQNFIKSEIEIVDLSENDIIVTSPTDSTIPTIPTIPGIPLPDDEW